VEGQVIALRVISNARNNQIVFGAMRTIDGGRRRLAPSKMIPSRHSLKVGVSYASMQDCDAHHGETEALAYSGDRELRDISLLVRTAQTKPT
jgi:hypothetical protein